MAYEKYIFPSVLTSRETLEWTKMSEALSDVSPLSSGVGYSHLSTNIKNALNSGNYYVGVDFSNATLDGDNATGTISELTIFLKSGDSPIVVSNHSFSLERNTILYIDLADATPTLKKGNEVLTSAMTYGNGAFYDDEKILILGNHYGSWIGHVAPQFMTAVEVTKEKNAVVDTPNLMAQKVGNDYFIYVKSPHNKIRYARFKFEHKEQAYATGAEGSNVNVHTLNQVLNVAYNGDGTFNEYSEIAQSGAWDLAMRESGVSDGSGGIAHGDEVEGYFAVTVNGIETLDISTELTEYDKIELIAGSTVYRDSQTYSTLTPLAKHFKSYTFDSAHLGRMVLDSKIIMERDATLLYAYLSMAPLTKTYTNRAISDIDVEMNDLNATAPIHSWRENIKRISLYGTNVGVNAKVIEMETVGTPVSKVEEVVYNKIYFNSVSNNEQVFAGDVLRTKTEFEFAIR